MLSDNFSYEEAIASENAERIGLKNIPDSDILAVMKKTAMGMEKVRAALGNVPIHINSWYRCPLLNSAIGSNNLTSQHPRGEAVDFISPLSGTPFIICQHIIAHKDLIRFDQLILEHSWVHISFDISTNKPRGQVLSLLENKSYAAGLTDKKGNNLVF